LSHHPNGTARPAPTASCTRGSSRRSRHTRTGRHRQLTRAVFSVLLASSSPASAREVHAGVQQGDGCWHVRDGTQHLLPWRHRRDTDRVEGAIGIYRALAMANRVCDVAVLLRAGGCHERTILSSADLFSQAMSFLEAERGQPTLESVQVRLMKVHHLLGISRPNEAWYTSWTVVQLTWALGLHRAALHPDKSALNQQAQRRTFWSVYATGKYLSIAMGRPMLLHDCRISQDERHDPPHPPVRHCRAGHPRAVRTVAGRSPASSLTKPAQPRTLEEPAASVSIRRGSRLESPASSFKVRRLSCGCFTSMPWC
jgi:hypothetical protein